jgi:hypothetical protein
MAMHTEIKRTTTTFVILAIAATLALVMVTSSIDSALAVRNNDIGRYSTTNSNPSSPDFSTTNSNPSSPDFSTTNSNPSSPETMGKNSIGNQDLNNFDQCVQKAALDGDGLGLNEVASCYSQVFANGAMQSNGG